jgi:DNA-binding CsgD family transcriptional regulator
VELDGDRIRFTHPLLAAGAYETADPLRRAEVHVRLAELLEDPEARAWQLAASVDQPDEVVAAALEDAARHARARGAPRPAALLLDRAQELTPVDQPENALRRAVEGAYLHFESGDSPRAEAQLRDVVAPLGPGRERAKALNVLARIRTYDAPHEAVELFRQVVVEAEGEALAADVLLSKVTAEALLGRTTVGATADKALALQEIATDRRVLDQPLIALAEYWTWIDAPGRARDTLGDLLRRATELGDENSRPWLLTLLGEAECALGNLADALDHAREAAMAAEQSGQPLFAALSLALESLVQAQLGRPDETTEAARRALELVPGGAGKVGLVASFALGHLELARNAPARATASLDRIVEFVRRETIVEPGATRFVIEQIEALIELGRLDEAVELLNWYEGNARRLERASALASCLRYRGLLAAQRGDLDEGLHCFEEALEWHAAVELPLDRGRTLLALGAAQRRAKRRREARETLEEALETFERIGAELWAERARAELRRISGRAATKGALTPAEERVASLVAEGKTNREVAAALFLSERTVEGHLSHVFGKLGVRSRTELTRKLASRATQVAEASNPGDSPVSPVSPAP